MASLVSNTINVVISVELLTYDILFSLNKKFAQTA